MRLVSQLHEVRRWITERGAFVTALYALHRLLVALFRGRARIVPYVFFAQPVGVGAFDALREDTNTQVARVDLGDPIEQSFPRPAEVIYKRHATGSICYTATYKNEFAGYIWIAGAQYVEDEVACTYILAAPQCSVWDFDVYVEPRLRLGRTMARMWKAVDRSLTLDGKTWSFSRISLFNAGSLSSHRRLGAQSVGWATFVVIGPLQFSVASLTPRLTLTLAGRSGPMYRLSPPASHPRL